MADTPKAGDAFSVGDAFSAGDAARSGDALPAAEPPRIAGVPVGPPTELSPLIAASTHWLARAYPADDTGPVAATLVELQARQAVTVAAWLRYPTAIDAELVAIAGPGGSAVLDWRVGSEPDDERAEEEGWRSWVDEVVVGWAACLLADAVLAARAVAALVDARHETREAEGEQHDMPPKTPQPVTRPRPYPRRAGGLPSEFRRLTMPDARDRAAATLLRHPDLLAPVADPHRDTLMALLNVDAAGAVAAA